MRKTVSIHLKIDIIFKLNTFNGTSHKKETEIFAHSRITGTLKYEMKPEHEEHGLVIHSSGIFDKVILLLALHLSFKGNTVLYEN